MLSGPGETLDITAETEFNLVNPDQDVEIRPEVVSIKHEVDMRESFSTESETTFSDRFLRFSSWNKLVRTIARIKYWARKCKATCTHDRFDDPELLRNSELAIILCVQRDSYEEELKYMKDSNRSPRNSIIKSLSPILDSSDVLRVGGRLNNVDVSEMNVKQRNPIILPKDSHITRLIIGHYHSKVYHQGRHFTEGAVRSAGYWVVGVKRMVSSFINKCVLCRRLRGKFNQEKMSDLPTNRCKPIPPFLYVGVDTFGPWLVAFRRTRGGSAELKTMGFACLVTRAIHFEIIEQLSSSSFISALRRFVALRGPVIQFCSNRGTNFVVATEDLAISAEFIENEPVSDFRSNSHTTWQFNPPYPHTWVVCGTNWNRETYPKLYVLTKTRTKLVTLMSEICAILNNRSVMDAR